MLRHVDSVYLDALSKVLLSGVEVKDRTGVGTISLFGLQEKYDLTEGFPLLTTKKVFTKGVVAELLFFLQGRTDNQWLMDRGVHIWDEWSGSDGDLGPIYGYQWNFFGADYVSQQDRDNGIVPSGGVNQLLNVLQSLSDDPFSRRHIVSAWNPVALNEMALPPCHTMFQFYVTPDDNGKPYGLSCHLYQRSGDMFLGVPFNIASYSILTHLFADLVGLTPLYFVHTIGDAHIYQNHIKQVETQLSRRDNLQPMPTLTIHHPVPVNKVDFRDPELFSRYSVKDFRFDNYNPLPAIPAPVAV